MKKTAAAPRKRVDPTAAAAVHDARGDGSAPGPETHPRWGTLCMVCLRADAARRTMLLCRCGRGCHVECHGGIAETTHRTDGVPDYTHRGEWECQIGRASCRERV